MAGPNTLVTRPSISLALVAAGLLPHACSQCHVPLLLSSQFSTAQLLTCTAVAHAFLLHRAGAHMTSRILLISPSPLPHNPEHGCIHAGLTTTAHLPLQPARPPPLPLPRTTLAAPALLPHPQLRSHHYAAPPPQAPRLPPPMAAMWLQRAARAASTAWTPRGGTAPHPTEVPARARAQQHSRHRPEDLEQGRISGTMGICTSRHSGAVGLG